MNYTPYPKKKDTPKRRTRKSDRGKIFVHNRFLSIIARKKRRLAKKQGD